MGTGFSSKIGSSKKYSNLQQRYEETIYAYYKAGTEKKRKSLSTNWSKNCVKKI